MSNALIVGMDDGEIVELSFKFDFIEANRYSKTYRTNHPIHNRIELYSFAFLCFDVSDLKKLFSFSFAKSFTVSVTTTRPRTNR